MDRATRPRMIVGVMHPMFIQDACGQPVVIGVKYDRRDAYNKVAAIVHRVGRALPDGDNAIINDFKLFATLYIKLIRPLSREELPTTYQWLDSSSYSVKRCTYLADLRNDVESMNRALKDPSLCDSFIKDEMYREKAKVTRGINSYKDALKVLLGPYFRAIDKRIAGLKCSVKGMRIEEIPWKEFQLFGFSKVIESDFSTFEAHHRKHMAEIVSFFFAHMIRGLGISNSLKRLLVRLVKGVNKINMGSVRAELDESLMSGALWTSSANTFLNFMIMSYLFLRAKYPLETGDELSRRVDSEFVGLVEGDDGIVLDVGQSPELAEKLGLLLKFEHREDFTKAHFCGCECCMTADGPIRMKDPLVFLREFFVLDPKLLHARQSKLDTQLRAKALSGLCLYLNVPVIGPICQKVCDLTRNLTVNIKSETNSWKRDILAHAISTKIWRRTSIPSEQARLYVAERYGISLSVQLELENSLGKSVHLINENVPDFAYYKEYFVVPYEHRFMSVVPRHTQIIPEIVPISQRLNTKSRKISRHFGSVNVPYDDSARAYYEEHLV